ncbi:MAG: hypothetical protein P1U56_11410 [Saprospiraceae bacterium]|nr:hypothetical protein [Saprospiraceae bacterium]
MYDDIKATAIENLKQKKKKKRAVYTVGAIFSSVAIILYVISLNFHPFVAYWIKFPILVLALVYAIIYFSVFGIPFLSDSDELSQEEIELEMVKIYRLQKSNDPLNDDDSHLELKDIEALKDKWEDNEEEFV